MTQRLTLSSLPLFPLGAVLFPDGELALRVFEVRYLDLAACRTLESSAANAPQRPIFYRLLAP